jgi:glycosyltransferase involved in cell wall biosynthesis
MNNITAVILTFNEAIHLERCIKSLAGLANDIVIVDSFSTDDTCDIARRLGARVFQNPWVNYANQFQWGLDNGNIETPWILRIDADEYVENELKEQITTALNTAQKHITGFYVRRKYVFLGRWIRFGAMYPIDVLRLWRKGCGRIEQRWMDEHIVLERGSAERLTGNIVDDNLNSVGWWVGKHNGYATREMIDLLNLKYGFIPQDESMERQEAGQAKLKRWFKKSVYANLPYFVRPIVYFLYRYFLKLGFLDGTRGFAFHFMQGCWYRCLVDLKMLEAERWIEGARTPAEIRQILTAKTGLALDINN